MVEDKITEENLGKYRRITEKALSLAEKAIAKSKKEDAEEILKMVRAYMSDSKHFQSKGDLVNSFGAIYYAHGWLDCGARLKIFDVSDSVLFTV